MDEHNPAEMDDTQEYAASGRINLKCNHKGFIQWDLSMSVNTSDAEMEKLIIRVLNHAGSIESRLVKMGYIPQSREAKSRG